MPSLLIVAGETSGDLHGGHLVGELRSQAPELEIHAIGGPRMAQAGARLLHDSTRHATVGIVEAVRNFGTYASLYRRLVSFARSRRPDVVVLIDLPDFNLKFGRYVRRLGIPIVYYISPQVWAWRPGRLKTIAKLVRKMLVILPFEEELYRKEGVDVSYVGNPLLDEIPQGYRTTLREELGARDLLIGVLPASRKSQFERLFPVLMKTCRRIQDQLPATKFVVACAPNIDPRRVERERGRFGMGHAAVVHGRTYDVMAASDLLLTASGTATLEAGLFGTPMIVTYKLNTVTAAIALSMLRIRSYALVNIVAGRKIVPELYQLQCRPELLADEALSMIREGRLPKIREELKEIRRILGRPGASRRAAGEILDVLKNARAS
jgi:lipid-A-disaccharide synthase